MTDIIYKYMPFREEFFENRWLRFTPRLELNDPFEVRPSFSQHAKHAYEVHGYGNSVSSNIAKMERSLPFLIEGIVIQDFDIYGILALTERNDHILMWSHYAGNHKGMVIGFDTSHDFFDGTKSPNEHIRSAVNEHIGVLKKVRYSSRRKIKSNDLNEYFYLKSNDWWTEREHRYVLPISEADHILDIENETMAFYQIPHEAILSVTIGLKSSRDQINKIKLILASNERYAHIELFQAKMCNESYDVIIEPMPTL